MIAKCTLFSHCGSDATVGLDDSLRCRGLGPTAAPIRGGISWRCARVSAGRWSTALFQMLESGRQRFANVVKLLQKLGDLARLLRSMRESAP